MLQRVLSEKMGIDPKIAVTNVLLVADAFIWYFFAFNILRETIAVLNLPDFELLVILGVNFVGIALFGIIGAAFTDKFTRRIPFIYVWMITGVVFSLIPMVINMTTSLGLTIVSAIYGAYFGVGMPATMGYFAASTSVDNRAKLGGLTFLLTGLVFSILGNISMSDIIINATVLATVRGGGLLLLFLLKMVERSPNEYAKTTYASVISNRSFVLYFIPWCMFSLVNYMIIPVTSTLFAQGENFVRFSMIVENIFIAVFAVISGFLADIFGRKRLAIIGFVLLGFGYAVLGIAPSSVGSWYFYIFVDGIAWGIFFTIFLFTVWGDLAQGRNSDKFYVIGVLPYLFSNFMRILLGSYVAATIQVTAVFSFASFFLFLAVLPLYFAPETLPEKRMRERELKIYVEKARKIKEKYS